MGGGHDSLHFERLALKSETTVSSGDAGGSGSKAWSTLYPTRQVQRFGGGVVSKLRAITVAHHASSQKAKVNFSNFYDSSHGRSLLQSSNIQVTHSSLYGTKWTIELDYQGIMGSSTKQRARTAQKNHQPSLYLAKKESISSNTRSGCCQCNQCPASLTPTTFPPLFCDTKLSALSSWKQKFLSWPYM